MDSEAAVEALSALAYVGRLDVFRLLVKAGHEGLPAGEIARQFSTPANTMSAQLAILARAGLIRSRREGRSIIYHADIGHVTALLRFLVQDCCNGVPEICAPLAELVSQAACCAAEGDATPSCSPVKS